MAALGRLVAALAAWLLLAAGPAAAQTFPPFTGLVVDAANVLPPQTRAALTAKLEALQRETHRQLVVATIPDLQGYPLSDYGYRLGRAWGVGLRDVDNGVVLFVAPNEPKGQRGPRIEVGSGLEGIVPDALAGQIVREQMMPRLRANDDVVGAMTAGTDALIAQLRASPDEAKARTDAAIRDFDRTHRRGSDGGGIPIGLIFWLFVLGFVALTLMRGRGTSGRSRRHRRGGGGGVWPVVLWGPGWGDGCGSSWGGGSFGGGGSDGGWGGGGFTGGGGGSFGGGGASGDW